MKYQFLFIVLLMFSCKEVKEDSAKVVFNQSLADELVTMAATDQVAASNAFPPEDFKHLSQEAWEAKKDSIYKVHQTRLEEILDVHGYPGYDMVGKEGEKCYWLMVQHADFDPDFQSRVLKELKGQVDLENANARNFGLLTDRVKLNIGEKQIYGTQVRYVPETGQAVPKPLADSLTVNERRKSVDLEPIEEYLNGMTISHFEMNKENMLKRGIMKPRLHALKK